MEHKPRILLVEDEPGIADTVQYVLNSDGFTPLWCSTAAEALRQFSLQPPALVILDVGLPDLNGFELFKRLQALPGGTRVPMLFLTARSDEIDRVVGLELGADDYVTKPYSARELIARIRAVLRRGGEPDDAGLYDGVLEAGPVRMDVERHVVSVNGEPITLPLKEFDLLEYLMRNSGRVLTRGQLIDRVWGADYVGDTKTLDVHVKRLRSKIESDPANPVHLVTVRGLGYKLEG